MAKDLEQSAGRIVGLISEKQGKAGRGAWFSLEFGRGETYCSGRPTMYGHWPYPRHSVLAGRECRQFIDQWDNVAEAREALGIVKAECKTRRLKFKLDDTISNDGGSSGSSFVPVAQVISHIPDDTDY